MAIFHWDVKIIGRSTGRGAIASVAYRSGEKVLDEKMGKTYDYSRRKGVIYTDIMTPKNVPDWVTIQPKLWNEVEGSEKRKDSQIARDIMIALPAELNSAQRIKLVRGYISEQFIKKGMIADFAIHAPSERGDERNFHVHILLTMRYITLEGFGCKAREWNAKYNIYQWRQAWERHANQALEQAGLDCRIDGRSHASKGLDHEPRLHLGFKATNLERKGEQSDRGNENRAIEARNEMREKLQIEQTKDHPEFDGLDLVGQQQGMSGIAPVQYSVDTIPDEIQDKIIDHPLLQNESTSEDFGDQEKNQDLSLEGHRVILEQKNKAFEERVEEFNRQIKNTSDENAQSRLQLIEKLEKSDFTLSFNKILTGILVEEDPQKNANEIYALQINTKSASQAYKRCADEWNYRAVRDGNYTPFNKESADKINKIKEIENKKWADFAVKAEKNGWSPLRIEKESQTLQSILDQQLAVHFGIALSLSFGMSM